MHYRRYIPPPPLAALVGCLWYSEGQQGTHERERLLPNGESGIVFDLRERDRRGPSSDPPGFDASPREAANHAPSVFCGARSDSFLLDTCQQERVIGIQFRPGGAFPFLGMPASELANASWALDDIWPGEAALLREELLAAANVDAMFRVLLKMLMAKLRSQRGLHPAVSFGTASLGASNGDFSLAPNPLPVRVKDVVDQIGLSSRYFKEIFLEQTGLTPKAFQRVRRFQHVLQALRGDSQQDLAEIAIACGYFDQAHFIHDFKDFSGVTPGEYLAVATPHLNHLPVK